jgi:transcriptional regulator with XRE-family HTH domain
MRSTPKVYERSFNLLQSFPNDFYSPMSNANRAAFKGFNGRHQIKPKRIRKLRDERGWTQEMLAAEANCSAATISNLENGKRAYACTIKQIADVAGEPYTSFLRYPPPKSVRARGSKPSHGLERFGAKKHKSATFPEVGIEKAVAFQQFDETEQLADFIKSLASDLKVKVKRIYILEVSEGSVMVRMRMPKRAVIRLIALFAKSQLSDPEIIAIEVTPRLAIPASLVMTLSHTVNYNIGEGTMVRLSHVRDHTKRDSDGDPRPNIPSDQSQSDPMRIEEERER